MNAGSLGPRWVLQLAMATKTKKKETPQISANLQWSFLAGLAILGVIAVFVFGIGTSDSQFYHGGGGGHGGLINLLGLR